MKKKCNPKIILFAFAVLALGINVSAWGQQVSTATVNSSNEPSQTSEQSKRFFEFMKLWRAGKKEESKKYFAKDSIGLGETTWADAVLAKDLCKGAELFREAPVKEVREKGKTIAVVQSSWIIKPTSNKDHVRMIFIEETFTGLVHNGISYLDSYKIVDVSAARFALSDQKVAKRRAELQDQATPKELRMKAGVYLYLELCNVGRFDQMWPILVELKEMGIVGTQRFGYVQHATRLAKERVFEVPAQYKGIIEEILAAEDRPIIDPATTQPKK